MTGPAVPLLESNNPRMQRILQILHKIAPTDATVILIGETGTGKDLLAHSIHDRSKRHQGPFVEVDSGAMSDTLLESELFGHLKGSFTGAFADKVGLIEDAQRGTVFLNEVGEASHALQLRLLHLLQYREFRRIGSQEWFHADVRFVAATNKDLKGLVSAGKFRGDLYHRLKLVELRIPPLRDRLEDLPALIQTFLPRLCTEHGKPVFDLTADAHHELLAHPWPGNVRELERCIEYLILTVEGNSIQGEDVRHYLSGAAHLEEKNSKQLTFFDGTKVVLEQALRKHNWNKSQVAEHLGIDRTTLYRQMKKYGIDPAPPDESRES